MELMASSSLNFHRSFPAVTLVPSTSRDVSPSFYSTPIPSSFRLKLKGSQLPKIRLQSSSLKTAAVLEDTTAAANNSATQQVSLTEQPYVKANHEVPKSGAEQEAEDLDDLKMVRVVDKLIGVFMVDKPTPNDWRRLLVFSKTWSDIRPHFFKRCQERADNDNDPEMKHKLLRLARKLREIDADVQRHNELLQVIRSGQSEIGEIVAKRRKDFTREFFLHLHTVADSYYDNPTEQDDIGKLGNTTLAAVQAYDIAAESIAALDAAELKFQDILNSPSLDAACRKIDDLASKKQLDPAFVLMINKAWAAAKDTDMTKDEAKEILYHLYMTAQHTTQRDMPKEVRILKYLLMIEDPAERLSTLNDAFTPGDELQAGDIDYLYTTPQNLFNYIQIVIDAYKFSQPGTLIQSARDLMNPKVIQRLEELQKLIQDQFM